MRVRKHPLPEPVPFNPLDKTNLGISIADALMATVHSTLPPKPFKGAGVYAIYYIGSHQAYRKLIEENAGELRKPIYVGKAVPRGSRKGKTVMKQKGDTPLQARLMQHANSIKKTDLDIDDFVCRYLVVDDIFIPLGETLLIDKHEPVWNVALDGFGIHDPGAGRLKQERSRWDVLHPGRTFAQKQPCGRTPEQIMEELESYYQSGKAPPEILEANIEDEAEVDI